MGDIDTAWLTAPRDDAAKADASDLGAQLALARVHVEKPDGSLAKCSWDDKAQKHTCPGLPSWMYVARESHVVGGDSSRCVWSHPITGGKVVIRYDGVRLRDSLRFSHALADSAAGTAGGASVSAEILVDGKSLGKLERENAVGWARRTFPVAAPGERAAVTIEVTTPNDGARHYCWNLETVAGANRKGRR